jgi:hypothetical protein
MTDEQIRETLWRQGLVLEHQAAIGIGLLSPGASEDHVVVMVTHDCDIASSQSLEPNVELLLGRRIEALGSDIHAKTARRLHISYETEQGLAHVEFQAIHKQTRIKIEVLSKAPRANWKLTPEGLVTLQKWLSARYFRSAFSDEFERRLKAKPAKLDKKIAKALDEPSQHILAVYFDVDAGKEIQRNGESDVYQLNITLLYDSTKDEPVAYEAAQKAAESIEDTFENAFCVSGQWKHIRLLSCSAVSDFAMTIAQSRLLKQWRMEHVSLEADPQQATLD